MTYLPTRAARALTACLFALAFCAGAFYPQHTTTAQSAVHHTITWDAHSLLVDGKRVFVYSGEFHYWRLPAREQWLDRLQKMKAAGLNAVSIYFDWQYHSSAPGQYDFSGVRDVNYLLNLTDRLGLYVIARVGPYMNAEVDAGGLPGWLLTKPLFPRSQSWDGTTAHAQYSALYAQYSKEWYDHLLPILARHQATDGKSVLLMSIENEYSQPAGAEQYMSDLYRYARDDGMRVPLFHNDYWFRGDWSKLVDLYAYDSYPFGFSCCHQWYDFHFHGVDSWESTLRGQISTTTPMFVSELQGGAFDPWGGKGYQAIADTLNGDWLNTLDESALAQGTSLLNSYMFVGGTTWGYMSEPGVYTSYDYGAPISEAGVLRPAYYAAHRLGMFLASYGPSLAGADAAPSLTVSSDPTISARGRINAQTGQFFAFLRHGDPGDPVDIKLQLAMAGKTVTVPQQQQSFITIPGHSEQLLTGNVDVGPLHMNYSTSQVLADASTGQGHYLVLYGPPGSSGETDFVLPPGAIEVAHNPGVHVTKVNGELRLNYTHLDLPRTVAITTAAGTVRLLITSTDAASKVWIDHGLVVVGPDLVESLSNGSLSLSSAERRAGEVYGQSPGKSLLIDGRLTAAPDPTMGAILLGPLPGPATVALPPLNAWKFHPESPEIQPAFDDSQWQIADHATTTNPNVPAGPSLLADDYGFHYGFVWYRGHFTGTGQETGISIAARHSYSVYLNGSYLASGDASLADPPHAYAAPQTIPFPPDLIQSGRDNVVAVLTESLGHDEGWLAGPLAQSPQGILSAHLEGPPEALTWRIQGDLGGEHATGSPGGLLNASGLFGERNGWYLPAFDDAAWTNVTLPDDWRSRGVGSGVGWYRTHFTLHLSESAGTALGLTLDRVGDKAVIWLNGTLLGRYWEQMGPQHTFYLPQGILRPGGRNDLAIAVWNRGHRGGLLSIPTLNTYAVLRTHVLATAHINQAPKIDYLHTAGSRIVDSTGRPMRIAAVNWSGMQNRYFVPAGLDKQALDTILARIAGFGFNTIRLPFSNQMVEQNPVVDRHVEANPDLQGLRALDILDRIVEGARRHGLRIILEDHRSDVGTDPQGNGLWYTTKYPESAWIRDWQQLAARYKGNPTVVGVDLRNEPHTGPPGPWSIKTYLTQGATWGPYHGVDNVKTDWRLAAARGGNAILAVNPRLLIFVEGIQQYPDVTQPGGLDSYWWGGILTPARAYPVQLEVPQRLVYSPHEYGPFKYQQPFFGAHMSYEGLSQVWARHWEFLEHGPSRTPIFIGEFGTCGSSVRCVVDSTPGSQGLWFQFLMRYLREHPDISWSFWALNGTNPQAADQPNYILSGDWRTVRMHQLIDALRDIQVAPPPSF
ncbi:MAG: hypothetical protein PVSMB7_13540 [Chloroflexota bacterium]